MDIEYTFIYFSTIIRRGAQHGIQNGLNLLIDLETYDNAYNLHGSVGAYIDILHPLDVSILSQNGIQLESGKRWSIGITPSLVNTTLQAKHRFSPEKRNCYFEDEITLDHLPREKGYR